jgi:hypothetical protein
MWDEGVKERRRMDASLKIYLSYKWRQIDFTDNK